MRWRNNSVGRYYESNESTVVYFDSRSGDTHLLSDFAAHVMRQFGDQLLTIEDLVDQMSPSLESADISDLKDAIPDILEELVALDILQRE